MFKWSKLVASLLTSLFLLLGFCSDQAVLSKSVGKQKPMVIAHRGGKVWAPENTMAAFKKSVALGVDGIELDIHKCKSGELVVIHDETINRTTDGTGLVKDFTYEQLQTYSAGRWFHRKFKSEKIPLLTDVLALVNGKAHIFIEVKNAPIKYAGLDDDLIKLLKSYKHRHKITVISFDHEFLKQFHKKAPQYKIAFLDLAIVSDIGKYASSIGASAWNPGFGEIRADAVDRAHKAGLKVNPWTVNGKKLWKRALSMGVDGIITDDPEGLTKVLGQKSFN